ncbi:hypothetical protein [uncultured Flavonifractor sp.]|uniref:hypothetical protein n=1 Tax=uncultured Flavonifractor sp. TaxID=1193534 RepID=UPI002612DEBB|nr:hypothetical protein [uncultured Flavonifractor sp.]
MNFSGVAFFGACAVQAFWPAAKTLAQAEFISAEHEKKRGPRPTESRVGNHADNPFNNRCDELAVAESRKYK